MEKQAERGYMGMWGVAALGIGSMVGAGIFALLGQAIHAAGQDVLLSFALAGVAALFSGYSYAALASKYPVPGGILDYYAHGFTSPALAGALSLLYLFTLAVSISMVAKTFGVYAADLFFTGGAATAKLLALALILGLALLNSLASDVVGRAETMVVGLKLLILLALMAAGLPALDWQLFNSEPSSGLSAVMGSVGLTFFAFAGFGMMTNAAAEVRDPAKTIPRAIYLAISLVLALYVGLALVVLGSVPRAELLQHPTTALAQAAMPLTGEAGFTAVSVAALLATASAVNAMLFSFMRISAAMAGQGQLPAFLGGAVWRNATWSLFWGTALILAVTWLLDLSATVQVASATFLICYLAVFAAHWRLRKETASSGWIIAVGFALMLVLFLAFAAHLFTASPLSLVAVGLLLALGFGAEWLALRKKNPAA